VSQNKHILTILCNSQSQEEINIQNQILIFRIDKKIKIKQPINKIEFVILVGATTITTPLIKELNKNQIPIIICDNNFLPVSQILPVQTFCNSELKIQQFKIIQNKSESLKVAKSIIQTKIKNQLKLLLKRKKLTKTSHTNIITKLETQLSKITDSTQLLGLEGSYSTKYFQLLFSSIDWKSRIPRQKPDISNLLLDIGYTYLYNSLQILVIQKGFEPTFGFLHTLYYQRKSLVCDIMEPFRPLVDEELIKAWSLKKINSEDFEIVDGKYRIKEYKLLVKYINLFCELIVKNTDKMNKYVSQIEELIKTTQI
jgi:CRISP-associated protein Cas1